MSAMSADGNQLNAAGQQIGQNFNVLAIRLPYSNGARLCCEKSPAAVGLFRFAASDLRERRG
jgi:hypothetical protein